MSFSSETAVKAVRKRHKCHVCLHDIEIGEPATRWAGKTDGDFHSLVMHPDCCDAERDFNKEVDAGDWYSLAYDRDQDTDDWLVEAYPQVSARLGRLGKPSTSTPTA
jgi:hypothetical protein